MRCIQQKKKQVLSPALIALLQAVVNLRTANTKALARYLGRCSTTIDTEFKRIYALTDTHSRLEAVIYALRVGWIQLTPLDENPVEPVDNERYSRGLEAPGCGAGRKEKREGWVSIIV
jgi:DNA-binding CsgD family transcriptional regulator